MVIVNGCGYLEVADKAKGRRISHGKNWWLVKQSGGIELHFCYLGAKYIGKKVRFKVEVVDDEGLQKLSEYEQIMQQLKLIQKPQELKELQEYQNFQYLKQMLEILKELKVRK